jgi:uncharacterized protein YjeT (DUF2065 family)
MTIEIGSNLRLIGLAVLVVILVVQWWAFRARAR